MVIVQQLDTLLLVDKKLSGVKVVGSCWYFIVEYRDAFTLFDNEGDGKIDCEQIGSLLRSLNLNPDDEDIRKIEKDVGKKFSKHCRVNSEGIKQT